ncbi:hypothetical protein GDO86_012027 [Hymenochirus boettgeri]|uniref:Ubiquitin carboxyl-terminal hydrolase MINDY n=1 Tax=Hymenochirus boettgeri TaxID=247094 RepID=A0A8T2JGM4_9PIPI|nr:hypothetical protein GDO86_012027 [Hymenochirus boettgeri]KAG8443472.1 hypothetical protein GDO86_012027 [Hymenochirus boettgeri]
MDGGQNPAPVRRLATSLQTKPRENVIMTLCDLSDDETGESSAVSDTSKTEINRNQSLFSKGDFLKDFDDERIHTEPRVRNSRTVEFMTPKENFKKIFNPQEISLGIKISTDEIQRPKSSRTVRGMMSGPTASSQEVFHLRRTQRRSAGTNCSDLSKEEVQLSDAPKDDGTGNCVAPSNTALNLGKEFYAKVLSTSDNLRNVSLGSTHTLSKQEQKVTLASESAPNRENDVEDCLEGEIGSTINITAFLPSSIKQVEGTPIHLEQAVEIKKILFGSSLGCFSNEWKIQSFTFNNRDTVKYGFVQKKGGPCGVLAAVQGCVLKNLLFGKDGDLRVLQPSDSQRTYCLCKAISDILWRAGDSKEAVIALSSGRQQFSPAGRYKADGVLESLILYRTRKYEDLLSFVQHHISKFESGPFGCILFTVSIVLSRSVELLQKDFDVPTNSLIGAHAYCTQELVNLILTGRAVSNVFNDVMELDSGNGNITLLKGIAHRSDIGFLSLFEHYSVCQVGSYLKTPKYPIWVICSESHFSILFCLRKELMSDWRIERRFDLYYYDGLANQQEQIRLTIDTASTYIEEQENDLTPPLDHCIRTK